jgi:hypothetical protein
MMRVDIERVRAIKAELKAINNVDLRTIEFYEDGKKLEIDPAVIEDWKFTGLTNTTFIDDDYGVMVLTLKDYAK